MRSRTRDQLARNLQREVPPSITGANQSKFIAEDYAELLTTAKLRTDLNSAHNATKGRRENSRGKTGQCRQTLVRINGRILHNFLRKTRTKNS